MIMKEDEEEHKERYALLLPKLNEHDESTWGFNIIK